MTDLPAFGVDAPDPWRLDPVFFPRRIEFELSAACLEVVEHRARRFGRCRDEVILEMLNGALQDEAGA